MLRILFVLAGLLVLSGAMAGTRAPDARQRAAQMQLASQRSWQVLGHYEPTLTGGRESTVDNAGFFLAANGKTDPAAELDATLQALLEQRQIDGKPFRCLYPARAHWLVKILQLPATLARTDGCTDLIQWLKTLHPGSAVLVYPAAYLNNPASMFGHTLLRIDPPDDRTALDSYAINFAAQTRETNGALFAIKGLTGLYPGAFGVMPYYKKVKDYSAIENRDIWEFQLSLTQPEIRRMLWHLWELKRAEFDYYFFDENCSYQLLSLLQAARPSLHLTDQFIYQAIPSDTLRVVAASPGLITGRHFRPSLASQLAVREQQMSAREKALALQLADGQQSPDAAAVTALPQRDQAAVLETAYDLHQYRYNREGGSHSEQAGTGLALLRARSKLPTGSTQPPVPTPTETPYAGHPTARWSLGGGSLAGQRFGEFDIRAAYHDLLDPPGGYKAGAQIDMFQLALRHSANGSGLKLEAANLVDILSLSPHSEFFPSWSWTLNGGFRRTWIDPATRPLAGVLHGGGGLAFATAGHGQVYGFLSGTLLADHKLDPDFALGAGPELGWIFQPAPGWRVSLHTRWEDFPTAGLRSWDTALEQNFALSRNWGLRLSLGRERVNGHNIDRGSLALEHYF